MLDLTAAVSTELYEIKMLDGQILHLKRPTQALQQTIVQVKQFEKEESKLINCFIDIFIRIINRNKEGITYTKEDIAENYDISIIGLVVKDYFTYWNKEIEQIVNFQ